MLYSINNKIVMKKKNDNIIYGVIKYNSDLNKNHV